ncbi:hypothetical protein ES332_D03G085800v1 [Gossypium tomentosum]|uniref:Uncharacterized protein n=1 Tax=Gossypium tomentosum TaxID=34277 RepID=A0A5D2LJV5_GOSTO|nr:hypothetical protein ES332_D03G085800v1 [Gossypium tomentosum]
MHKEHSWDQHFQAIMKIHETIRMGGPSTYLHAFLNEEEFMNKQGRCTSLNRPLNQHIH